MSQSWKIVALITLILSSSGCLHHYYGCCSGYGGYGEPACGADCFDAACGAGVGYLGPFHSGWRNPRHWWGGGCGDLYLDEWISDPPDHCDPCDHLGNWTGYPGCCRKFSILAGLHTLWGYRHCSCYRCRPSGPFHGGVSPVRTGFDEVIYDGVVEGGVISSGAIPSGAAPGSTVIHNGGIPRVPSVIQQGPPPRKPAPAPTPAEPILPGPKSSVKKHRSNPPGFFGPKPNYQHAKRRPRARRASHRPPAEGFTP